MDSNGILEITKLPASLVIVGGGVIGVEFACFFASVGVPVTVVEALPEICPGIDEDCTKILRAELEKKGVAFRLGAKVLRIDGDAVVIAPATGGEERVAAAQVLIATGRRPNSEGLEPLGLDMDRVAVRIDERCRTNIPGVWAIGDLTARSMLAHSASRMGEVAVDDMLGGSQRMRYTAIPGVVYTSPELAVVGRSEAGCKRDGIPVKVAKWPLGANGRFLAEYEGKGLAKVVVHAEDRRVLGVHLVGAACSEMIHGLCTAIENEIRLDELVETIFPHPTASEAMRDALLQIAH
jgi:dihydrolipoamide dehydrogenase